MWQAAPARSALGWRRAQLFPTPLDAGGSPWPFSLALLGVSGQKTPEVPKKVNSVCSADKLTFPSRVLSGSRIEFSFFQ